MSASYPLAKPAVPQAVSLAGAEEKKKGRSSSSSSSSSAESGKERQGQMKFLRLGPVHGGEKEQEGDGRGDWSENAVV